MKKTIRMYSLIAVLCVLSMPVSHQVGRIMTRIIPSCRGSELSGIAKAAEPDRVESTDSVHKNEGQLSSKTLILTVESSPVYWPEFYFWLNYIKKYYKRYHNLDKITDWSVEQNGMSLDKFFLSCAVGYACKDRAIEAKAEELGIKLSEKDLTEIEENRKSNIRIYGSELEYLRIVGSMYVSEEVFNYLTKIDYLGNYMYKQLYGANGEKCSDKDVLAYVKKEGYMCAKYILLSNIDPDGNAVSAKRGAENYKLLQDILGQLDASGDSLTLFNSLMDEYSEDATVSNYPNGRLFVSGEMGEEFERAYLELKENEYSGIVRAAEGYYIILRMPIFPDMITDSSGSTLRYRTAYDYMFRNQVEDWSAKMKINYEDAYYRIDVETLPDG